MVWLATGTRLDAIRPPSQRGELFTVEAGSPKHRVLMVPLITQDHPWRILDASAHMYSTRHALQGSCEGLYLRYDSISDRGGAWFAAVGAANAILGLATAVPPGGAPKDFWRIDAFAEHARADVCDALLARALAAARERGVRRCEAVVADDDSEKRQWLGANRFEDAGAAEPRDVHGVVFATRKLIQSG